MLNFDVKRKINTLRDILVGKVPDPKAQVEQITIALIYKFMDDMDLQGVDLGGNREFFKGDYEKYAFSQIMLAQNSAQERLNLYAEGIDKMTNNPDLPKLFRDILRNAYIPYRDPETLNRFLKEIADFSYEDSEELGNAFEYLLSIMGSQGDAGQFRTPRHIIDMMVEITAPTKNETILDPACGTAGFLISAYNYIKKQNQDEHGNSTLSSDDKRRMMNNFAGYDISPDMVRLSRVNMYLHGFANPKISEYDTLTSLDKWDDTYDVIFANPPFMTPKGGITPHNRYRVSAKRAEVLFVDYIAEHLNPTGRAAIIVPEGIVFQSQTAYKQLRKMLVDDNYLYGVISLPAGVFNPYSGVKTSILLIDRTLAKERDSILFVKLNNDGFDLGAQRREIKGSEIPDVINIFKDYQEGDDVGGRENVVLAKKGDIAEQDYILVGERYKTATKAFAKWPIVKLGDICEINPKKSEISNLPPETIVSFVPMATVNEHRKSFIPTEQRSISEVYSGYTYFRNGDVLLAKVTPCFENGKSGIAGGLKNSIGFGSSEFFVLRPNTDRVISDYLYRLISTDLFLEQGKLKMTGTGGLQRIPKDFLSNYMIPLPPLAIQEEIVTEIEGYQKIIDGARQVVENYKPTIKIDPAWPTAKVGEVVDFISGVTLSVGDCLDPNGLPLITIADVTEDGLLNTSNIRRVDPGKSVNYLQHGDLLFNWRNGSKELVGKTALFDLDGEYIFASFLLGIRPHANIDSTFLWLLLNQYRVEKRYMQFMRQNVNGLFNRDELKDVVIPVPPVDVQYSVCCAINEEMSIIKQNQRLIEIFQQKIKDTIAEVWGE